MEEPQCAASLPLPPTVDGDEDVFSVNPQVEEAEREDGELEEAPAPPFASPAACAAAVARAAAAGGASAPTVVHSPFHDLPKPKHYLKSKLTKETKPPLAWRRALLELCVVSDVGLTEEGIECLHHLWPAVKCTRWKYNVARQYAGEQRCELLKQKLVGRCPQFQDWAGNLRAQLLGSETIHGAPNYGRFAHDAPPHSVVAVFDTSALLKNLQVPPAQDEAFARILHPLWMARQLGVDAAFIPSIVERELRALGFAPPREGRDRKRNEMLHTRTGFESPAAIYARLERNIQEQPWQRPWLRVEQPHEKAETEKAVEASRKAVLQGGGPCKTRIIGDDYVLASAVRLCTPQTMVLLVSADLDLCLRCIDTPVIAVPFSWLVSFSKKWLQRAAATPEAPPPPPPPPPETDSSKEAALVAKLGEGGLRSMSLPALAARIPFWFEREVEELRAFLCARPHLFFVCSQGRVSMLTPPPREDEAMDEEEEEVEEEEEEEEERGRSPERASRKRSRSRGGTPEGRLPQGAST